MQFLLSASLVSIFAFANGSVLQSGLDPRKEITKRSGLFYGQPYSYGASSTVGLSSDPFWSNFGFYETPCILYATEDIVKVFRKSIFEFIMDSFRKTTVITEGHFVHSPHTAWLSLAAIAEGTEGNTRRDMFKILSLPEDKCLRLIFYRLAEPREFPSNDVILARNRLFVVDSSLFINKNWESFARFHTLLNTVAVPFKTNNTEIEYLKRVVKAQLPKIDLKGNSFLLESLDYHGLWASAFSDAVIESRPFYNTNGEEIGTMEYMKTHRRVNIGFSTSANLKVVEIPVGRGGRYKLLAAITLSKDNITRAIEGFKDDLVFEVLANLRATPEPIEIVIPRLTISSEIEMRTVLENMGLKSLWTDPLATR